MAIGAGAALLAFAVASFIPRRRTGVTATAAPAAEETTAGAPSAH